MAKSSDTANAPQQSNDVKQSFAWGQLFVGSILAGFSVYQLALKAMSMPPSEMLAGFVAAYEAVRDFLMLPFQWVQLDLTASDKNLVVVCMVLLGAVVRGASRETLIATLILVSVVVPLFVGPLASVSYWIEQIFFMLTATSIVIPLLLMALPATMRRNLGWSENLILLNIAFTMGWGTILLLLNWATS